jgi:hypothetical protein
MNKSDIEIWKNGFPQKIRRGFEVIKFNPKVIYVCYQNIQEFRLLQLQFGELIDNNHSITYCKDYNDVEFTI